MLCDLVCHCMCIDVYYFETYLLFHVLVYVLCTCMNLTFHVYIADLEMLSRVYVFFHCCMFVYASTFTCIKTISHLWTYRQLNARCQNLPITYKADISQFQILLDYNTICAFDHIHFVHNLHNRIQNKT